MQFQHQKADFTWQSLWWPTSPEISKNPGCTGPPIFNHSSVKHLYRSL